MTEPQTAESYWQTAWRIWTQAVSNRQAPARFPIFATVDQDGAPQARMVVLRAVDKAARQLEIHTDALSPKIAQLQRDARASLVFWDPSEQIQLRVQALVSMEASDPVRWAKIPQGIRPSYGGPAPGSSLTTPELAQAEADINRFVALVFSIQSLDLLHLVPTGHRRLIFRRAENWSGQWIAP